MTSRTPRNTITTDWVGRWKPIMYIAPLQDAYRKVHDQDNKVIYIISNSWKEVPATKWQERPVLNN